MRTVGRELHQVHPGRQSRHDKRVLHNLVTLLARKLSLKRLLATLDDGLFDFCINIVMADIIVFLCCQIDA